VTAHSRSCECLGRSIIPAQAGIQKNPPKGGFLFWWVEKKARNDAGFFVAAMHGGRDRDACVASE